MGSLACPNHLRAIWPGIKHMIRQSENLIKMNQTPMSHENEMAFVLTVHPERTAALRSNDQERGSR